MQTKIVTHATAGFLVLGLFFGKPSFGQDNSPGFGVPPGFGANQNMVTEFKGKLKGFQRGVVYVQREDGTDMMVQVPDNLTAFQFVALAKPAFLKRGQLVRLTGTFNPVNGMAVSPINKVELFQPVSGAMPGRIREQYLPGVYPQQQNENQQGFAGPVRCRVVGGVMGIHDNGNMVVQAGSRPLQIPLSPDVTFEIRFNNLTLAQEGDTVSVSGFYQPSNETLVKAERITVTSEKVFGEPTESIPKRGSRRRPTRGDKADEDKPAELNEEKIGGDQGESQDGDSGENESAEKPAEAVEGSE